MKKIIIGLFAISSFIACDKDEPNSEGQELNKFRVTQIKGSNEMWGENYTLKITYNNRNQVEKAYAVNNAGDTVTVISGRKDNVELIYTINDFERDKESGKLIKDVQTRCEVKNKMSGRTILTQEIKLFAPKPEIAEDDYEPEKYINISFNRYIYEYNQEGRIANVRRSTKQFNTSPESNYADNEEFDVFISKNKINYNENGVSSVENYVSDDAIGSENYRLVDTEVFSYSEGKLISVVSEKETVNYSYQGANVTVKGVVYTLNGDGFVTKIVKADGSITEIQYESGSGNFETLNSIFKAIYNVPIIK